MAIPAARPALRARRRAGRLAVAFAFSGAAIRCALGAPAGGVVYVHTADELAAALAAAQPGQRIELADGVYVGRFAATRNGTAAAPVTLHGSRAAVLDGGGVQGGYAFHLSADHWKLQGFTVQHAKKGIMADQASHNVLDGLHVTAIGEEAIHLRAYSRDNLVTNCTIDQTGLVTPGYGEGIYIGSAVSNWGTYTGGNPDASDGNRIVGNAIGPGVTAEAIDIKEGTSGGEIAGNVFDGSGMSGDNHADSWIDAKGNGYDLHDNSGTHALLDGFQTHVVVEGWGRDNVFARNHADVDAAGYGFDIETDGGDAHGNIVCSDNSAEDAGSGLANVATTPAPCADDVIFRSSFDAPGE